MGRVKRLLNFFIVFYGRKIVWIKEIYIYIYIYIHTLNNLYNENLWQK